MTTIDRQEIIPKPILEPTSPEVEERLKVSREKYRKKIRSFWIKKMPLVFAVWAIFVVSMTWLRIKVDPKIVSGFENNFTPYLLALAMCVVTIIVLGKVLQPDPPCGEPTAYEMIAKRIQDVLCIFKKRIDKSLKSP